ncbi:MAG: hypothetical protein IJJ45_06930 [Clostridia bacterium]|nr:hypothetical protein [Clostridia bacterium]
MNEESRYLSFSGLRLHFNVVRPENPVKNRILMLSSPLINTFHWRKLVPELQDMDCLLVVADLPGFGQSDPGGPQGASVRANMLWGVLDALDEAAGAPMSLWHLAGHGSACATILRMASMYPDSVKSQIHICPTFTLTGLRGDPLRWYDANVPDPVRFHRMVEHYAGYPMDDYIVDRMRRPLLRPGMASTFAQMLRFSAKPPATGMGFCPTMAILGGRDPLMDETRLSQVKALLGEAETHRIASAGHFPTETHSRALRDYLRGWLRYND